MANSPSVVDFSTPLADFLAAAVSDGTYSDIVEVLKVDTPGKEAAASQVDRYYGQLYANVLDDFMLAAYQQLAGQRVVELDTVGAVVDSEALLSLGADGDAWYIEVTVWGKTSAASELVVASVAGTYYRDAGVVAVIAPMAMLSDVGLAGANAVLAVSGTTVEIEVTGVAAKTIAWTAAVRTARELRAP